MSLLKLATHGKLNKAGVDFFTISLRVIPQIKKKYSTQLTFNNTLFQSTYFEVI